MSSEMQGPHMDRREYTKKSFLVVDAKTSTDTEAYAELWSSTMSGPLYDGQCLEFWYSLKVNK
jgi:hypothetical protein